MYYNDDDEQKEVKCAHNKDMSTPITESLEMENFASCTMKFQILLVAKIFHHHMSKNHICT